MTSTTTSSSNHTSYHTNIFTAPRTPSPHALQRPPATSFKFKLVLLGDQNTGKTCFRKRLMYDSFDNVHEPTLGIDIGVRQVETLGQDDSCLTSTLQIWDTSGSPRFENLLFSYCRHSQGAVLFFDTTNRASFANVNKWLAFFRRENVLGPDRTKLLLVGTKCDSPQRVIASTEAIDFARKHSLLYAEYDARSNRQRDTCEVLEPLVSKMIDAHKFDSLTLDDDSKAKQSVFAPVNAAFKQFCNKYFSCGSPIQS